MTNFEFITKAFTEMFENAGLHGGSYLHRCSSYRHLFIYPLKSRLGDLIEIKLMYDQECHSDNFLIFQITHINTLNSDNVNHNPIRIMFHRIFHYEHYFDPEKSPNILFEILCDELIEIVIFCNRYQSSLHY